MRAVTIVKCTTVAPLNSARAATMIVPIFQLERMVFQLERMMLLLMLMLSFGSKRIFQFVRIVLRILTMLSFAFES